MTSQLAKQLMVGAVFGGLISGGIWYLQGDKREELDGLKASNETLRVEVEKGKELKRSYEKLKKEVEEQENRLAELISLFPKDEERSRVAYMVQKIASASPLGQLQGLQNIDKPIKGEYYMEYPTVYKYLGGFHEFGKFLSYISGYEKIINISDIVMTRGRGKVNNLNPISLEFRLSIYVYDPKSAIQTKRPAGVASAAGSAKTED